MIYPSVFMAKVHNSPQRTQCFAEFFLLCARLFHLPELKGVGKGYLPSGQKSKADSHTGEHDRGDYANRQVGKTYTQDVYCQRHTSATRFLRGGTLFPAYWEQRKKKKL